VSPALLEAAAQHLVAARRARRPGERVPESCRPVDCEDALSIQQRVSNLVGDRIGGWKVALPPPGRINLAPMYASTIFTTSPCPVLTSNATMSIEPEVAFVLGRDLGPRAEEYTEAEIRSAISETRLVLELLRGRYADQDSVSFPEKLADGLTNQGLFVGPIVPGGLDQKLETLPVIIEVPDSPPLTHAGRHPSGHPLAPLVWLANFLASRGEGLAAGQIVTTGSYCGVLEAPVGVPFHITFDGLGTLSVQFVAS
jgi:2-keto-4-pentenoate hydratase